MAPGASCPDPTGEKKDGGWGLRHRAPAPATGDMGSTDMETEAYLRPPQVLTPPGPAYADELRQFQGIPGIERAPSGRLWATWYGGGVTEDNRNHVLLATSADDGDTWSDVKTVIDVDGDGPVRAYDPCLWHDPQGPWWPTTRTVRSRPGRRRAAWGTGS